MEKTKSFSIPKKTVYEAWLRVKANQGAEGVDGQTIEMFESKLSMNLYKIWNQMSSGSYFPPSVKAVAIPKKDGGERILGIPTVADRVAQMTVKIHFEPLVEPHFSENSYGYRPGRSAIDAIGITRKRCWKYDWVLEFDIRKLFDRIDHELLMRAVRKHTDCKWIILYIERWLKASFKKSDGSIELRSAGTPQGGVISPVLANLFLHYAFDKWMEIELPLLKFCRYADDGIVHCKSEKQALFVKDLLEKRLKACKLELHPDKTKIVYCHDDDRRSVYPNICFDFLGYTFRPRRSKNKHGKHFINFTPAVSRKALIEMKRTIRKYKINLRSDKTLEDLSNMLGSMLRGWVNYYGQYYKSALSPLFEHINLRLERWVMRKHKRFRRKPHEARHWLGKFARNNRHLFIHWKMGILPTTER
jgi:RNA-directed DNA polymerase